MTDLATPFRDDASPRRLDALGCPVCRQRFQGRRSPCGPLGAWRDAEAILTNRALRYNSGNSVKAFRVLILLGCQPDEHRAQVGACWKMWRASLNALPTCGQPPCENIQEGDPLVDIFPNLAPDLSDRVVIYPVHAIGLHSNEARDFAGRETEMARDQIARPTLRLTFCGVAVVADQRGVEPHCQVFAGVDTSPERPGLGCSVVVIDQRAKSPLRVIAEVIVVPFELAQQNSVVADTRDLRLTSLAGLAMPILPDIRPIAVQVQLLGAQALHQGFGLPAPGAVRLGQERLEGFVRNRSEVGHIETAGRFHLGFQGRPTR